MYRKEKFRFGGFISEKKISSLNFYRRPPMRGLRYNLIITYLSFPKKGECLVLLTTDLDRFKIDTKKDSNQQFKLTTVNNKNGINQHLYRQNNFCIL